jgi:glutathione S-transferase
MRIEWRMKLYFAPGACSLSPHIALREAGLPFSLERVNFGDRTSFLAVNPKGYVPALQLEDGSVLTEGAVIVQWIADQAPSTKLAPPNGTLDRVHVQEWLHFIATELHKGMTPLYSKLVGDDYKKTVRDKVEQRLGFAAKHLAGKQFLFGDHFTVADGYLFYCLRSWQKAHGGVLDGTLAHYYASLAARPSIKAALEAEGLEA